MATATKRHQALGDLLTRYTEAINAGTYSEPISLIGDTRLRMRLALTLAGVDVIKPTPGEPDKPTPGSNRRIFLPLVGR